MLFLKKTLSCNTLAKLNTILFAQRRLPVMHAFIQHTLVINVRISGIVFLQTTLLISCIVGVNIIKISPSH